MYSFICIFIFATTNIFVLTHGITVYSCENSTLSIACNATKPVIHIIDANYGRTSTEICSQLGNNNYTNCLNNTLKLVRNACEHKGSCTINVNNNNFGGDPCPNTSKYLEVNYSCGTLNCPAFEMPMCTVFCMGAQCESPYLFGLGHGPECTTLGCTYKCVCQYGFSRDKFTGKCVASDYCPQLEGPSISHEKFSHCGAITQPQCRGEGRDYFCPYVHDVPRCPCIPGYVCNFGYVRDTCNGNKCVRPQNCSTSCT